MKYKITAIIIASLIAGSIIGSAITAWRYDDLIGTQGHRDLASLKSSLAYLSTKNGTLRTPEESVIHAKTLVALSTISLGQSFDTLGEHLQNEAVELVLHIDKTPNLRLDSDNQMEKWAAQVRQCIVGTSSQGALAVAKCSRDAGGRTLRLHSHQHHCSHLLSMGLKGTEAEVSQVFMLGSPCFDWLGARVGIAHPAWLAQDA